MQTIPDLSDPRWFAGSFILLFLVIAGRYFIAAGIFHAYFYFFRARTFRQRRLSEKTYTRKQFKSEVGWSLCSTAIFALAASMMGLLWQRGYTALYLDAGEFPIWWLPASLLISLFLHETYYYWLHRWMHKPAVFKLLHTVHHESNITSAWTAFSFHPLEALLQAIFIPVVVLVLPMHIYVLLIQLSLMTLSSIINHLDIEIYPKHFYDKFPGKLFIGATHHSLHHKQFKYNYGLYFTIWDKWKKTESPLFKKLFNEKTAGEITGSAHKGTATFRN